MGTNSEHTNVHLPAKLEGGDLLALFDQLDARHRAAVAGRRKGAKVLEGCPLDATIPAAVEASWKRLGPTITALRAVTLQRDHAASAPAATDSPSANNNSDESWRAFEGWLHGWTRHLDDGDTPSASDASALHRRLFPKPEGMKFVGWRPRKQWTSMQSRAAILAEPPVAATVTALGGKRLLAGLARTHEAFGRTYGFNAAQANGDEAVDARPQFLAAKDALRDYVKKVEGSADPDVPESETIATWLLGPFDDLVTDFGSAPRAKPAAPPSPPAP